MILGKEEQILTIKELMKYGSDFYKKSINTLVNHICKSKNIGAFESLGKEDIQIVFDLSINLL